MTRNAAPAVIEAGPFERFRRGFPALKRKTYLLVCDKMIPHDRVRAAVDRFPDHLAEASAMRAVTVFVGRGDRALVETS